MPHSRFERCPFTISPQPPQVVRAVEAARATGVPVVWVCREHAASGVDLERHRAHLFANGGKGSTVAGTPGAHRRRLPPPCAEPVLRPASRTGFVGSAPAGDPLTAPGAELAPPLSRQARANPPPPPPLAPPGPAASKRL